MRFFLIFLSFAGMVIHTRANITPQLTVEFKNVQSLDGGTNYYGSDWSNGAFAVESGNVETNYLLSSSGGAVVTNITVYRSPDSGLVLRRSVWAQPVESAVAQFALGDVIPWPAGVVNTNEPPIGFEAVKVGDNEAAYYQSTNPAGAVLFIPSSCEVIAAAGGNVELDWNTSNGIMRTVYTLASSPNVRPARVFWTESPYDSPPVNLNVGGQQVFAVLHYNNEITHPESLAVTNINPDQSVSVSTQYVNGVWIDGEGLNQNINADGVEGLFMIEYYADGNYEQSLGLMPVQIMRPQQNVIKADIGSRLLPKDLYYGTEDLIPNIKSGTADGSVLLYAQDGPKYNWVFAQQKTSDEPWDVRIYWEHTDFMGVAWPFEVDWYSIDWPIHPLRYVVGESKQNTAPILVPSPLTAEIPYQEIDNNAAVSTSGRSITVDQPGRFLIKYTTHDDIWYDAMEGVMHTDIRYFDLHDRDWAIGTEITPYQHYDYVLRFNGTNEYAEAGVVEEVNGAENFTVEAWAYRDARILKTPQPFGNISGPVVSGNPDSGSRWNLYYGYSNDCYFGNDYQWAGWEFPGANDDLGQWHHLAGVCDGDNLMLYVDGVLCSTVYNPQKGINSKLTIGKTSLEDIFFCGKIDEVRFWNYARSAEQISAAMNTRLTGDEDGLAAYYPMDEGSGTIIRDKASKWGAYGTLYGSPRWVPSYHLAGNENLSYAEYPGFVYTNAGVDYNTAYYNYPTESTQLTESALFAVNTNNLLEIWWSEASPNKDMPQTVYYPSLVQHYRNNWPENPPEIVIASGRGHEGSQPAGASNITFDASDNPYIYYQNDRDRPGFNPNEEHALVLEDIVYALRNDLNGPDSSMPYVLVNYADSNSHPAMAVFEVLATNAVYPAFTNSITAGMRIQPPMPLAAMPRADNVNTICFSGPGWRDRKNEWWAKAAGDHGGDTQTVMGYWYELQDGYFFPSLGSNQLAAGTLVPWLSGGVFGKPVRYSYHTVWPENVPELKVAQTLYISPANSGLPDMHDQLSVDILYQQSQTLTNEDSVQLIDPTQMRGTYIDERVITSMEAAGLAKRKSPGRTYTFPGVVPSVGERLVYDPDQPEDRRLYIKGTYTTTLSGGYLLLNLLEASEYKSVESLAEKDAANRTAWHNAVSRLPRNPLTIVPNTPYDKAALTAGDCRGTGYVTVAFNNATNLFMVPEADPVSLSIIKIVPELAQQTITVIEPENAMDEKLTLRSELDFGGAAGEYYFEWRTLPPTSTGMTPTNTPPEQWNLFAEGKDKVSINIEGASLYTLVDNYFQCRYRPGISALAVATNVWSDWSLAYAPGWIERVLDAITPYEQRMTDMSENGVNQAVTMLQQAGAPYDGPVSMNGDDMDDFGLIQIYQTVLNRGEMLSVDAGLNYAAANASLLLAVSRLSDLYMCLGNEAFADAEDPTIAYSGDVTALGSEYTSMFCFDNLVPSLLDEEMALLRGRDNSLLPSVSTPPFYNRLPWNFTKDITGGELAYALNYGIFGITNSSPIISAENAEALYPQGHGDAWGHYLSALMGYYNLLTTPHFTWIPGISSILLGSDVIANVGYAQEQRFAEVAAARARTGVELLDRIHRKFYSPNQQEQLAHFWDSDRYRCWGMGDWASRAGQASLFDWVTANSLVPADEKTPSRNWAISLTNASKSRIDLGSHSFDEAASFTLEFWLQTEATNQPDLFNMVTKDSNHNVFTNSLALDSNGSTVWYCAQDAHTLITTQAVNDGSWHHIALIYDTSASSNTFGPQRTLMLDGEVSATVTSTVLAQQSWHWVMGARQVSSGSPITGNLLGNMDEFRFWVTARTTNEVAVDMNRCLSGNEPYLYAYLPFYAGSGTLAKDEAGNNNGSIYDGVWATPVATSNNLVPPAPNADTNGAVYYTISHINRDTIKPELDEIAASHRSMQSSLDAFAAGLNPLGVDDNTIPFDISPAEIDQGKNHFEQIYDRAVAALYNASLAFKQAQKVKEDLSHQYQSSSELLSAVNDSEVDHHNRLIEIFGYPYTDDIGPGGSYPQDYDGPDLVNYGIVDTEKYLGTAPTGQPVQVSIFDYSFIQPDNVREYEDYELVSESAADGSATAISTTTMWFADTGIQVKDPSWTGQRKAEGEIQRALGDYVQAWYSLQKVSEDYRIKMEDIESCFSDLQSHIKAIDGNWDLYDTVSHSTKSVASTIAGLKAASIVGEIAQEGMMKMADAGAQEIPNLTVGAAGISSPVALTVVNSGAPITAAAKAIFWAGKLAGIGKELAVLDMEANEHGDDVDFHLTLATNAYHRSMLDLAYDFSVKVNSQYALKNDLFAAIGKMDEAAQRVRTVLADGERELGSRTRNRENAARVLQTARYADMAFRVFRNEALQRYTAAFDLAARYTWLAAKAYDYETGLLGCWAETDASQNALSQIVQARAIGRVEELSGIPQIGGEGDPGLADVLARLKANWDVVKTRMGFNNPDLETRRISLRAELRRTSLLPLGDSSWQSALSTYRIDDLNELPEYLQYCKPIATRTNREPALVIPFSTSIYSGQNAFGLPLAGGDNAFNPSQAATKIRGVGVWLFNYNNVSSTNADSALLAGDPVVYLIPVGNDVLRASDSVNVLRRYDVVDQALPTPYTFGEQEYIEPDFIPIIHSLPESLAQIRRHAAFRAFKANDESEFYNDNAAIDLSSSISNSRLVGRSVWNTQWLLIIPGRSLLADPDEGLNRLIYGAGTGDGPIKRDGNGIKDIRILFHTYSIPGE